MTAGIPNHNPEQARSGYRVRVKGCLGADFLAWLDFPGEANPDLDETTLWITTTDQAALYGSLNRLRDLGLTLIAVEPFAKNIVS